MNAIDRVIFRFLIWAIPRRAHYHFPHWVKVVLNRWMKHRGDPGDRR